MSELPTIDQLRAMSDEEVAAMNRRMTKVAIRNIVIFVGIKVAISYGLHRWAKAAAKNA
jgi:hypothetical protein